jgi:hypothetical protein
MLESGSPKLDEPINAGTDLNLTFRKQATQQLQTYTEARRAHNLPLFPSRTAQQQAATGAHHAALFTKPLEEALTPTQFQALESRAKLSADPDRFKQRQVLATYLSSLAGAPIPPGKLDRAISAYGRTNLGLEDGSTPAVFTEIQRRHQENADTTKGLGPMLNDTAAAIYRGEAWEMPDLAAIPERLRPGVRDELQRTAYESRRTAAQVRPLADSLYKWALVEQRRMTEAQEASDADPADTPPIPLSLSEATERFQQLDITQQAALLYQVEARLDALPAEQRATATRAWLGISRSIQFIAEGIDTAGVLRPINEAPSPQLEGSAPTTDPRPQQDTDRAQLRQLSLGGASAKLYQEAEGRAARWTIAGSEQIPNWLLYFGGPVGWSALGSSMAGQSYSNARLQFPGADPDRQRTASEVSGVAQLGTEVVLTKLGLRLLKGKVPSLAALLSKARVTNPAARSIIGGTIGAAGAVGAEYTEEIVQDATDTYLQGLAAELSGIDPKTDWGAFLASYDPRSEQGGRLLDAILPYALIGSGAVGSYRHFKYGEYLYQSATALRQVGIPEARITDIIRSEPAVAVAKFKEAWKERDQAKAEAYAEALLASMRDNADLAAAAGFPVVESSTNEFTEELQWTVTTPLEDGTTASKVYETEQEAHEAWRTWAMEQHSGNLEALTGALTADSNAELLELLTQPGQLTETTRVEDRTDLDLTFDQAIQQGIATTQQLQARVAIYALEQGIPLAEAAAEVATLSIKARRFAEAARGSVYRSTVQLFRGADPKDILEDMSEDAWARAFHLGLYERSQAIEDIRALEALTGNKYLRPDLTFKNEQGINQEAGLDHLLEALSTLSLEYAFGRIQDGSLGTRLRQWLHTMVATFAGAFKHAKLLLRSKDLRTQIEAGNIDKRLLDLIADSVGLNPTAQESRFQQQAQAQIIAEALGDFEEIGTAIKGRLPHPETLHRRNHPLAGEVERIHDSLTTTTRRRTKRGKAVRNSKKANNFFLPIGEMADLDHIREAMNEKGFDFETPADLLAAVADSVSYNIPTYATNSATDSYSIGTADQLQNTLLDRIGEEALRLEQPRKSYADKQQLLLDFSRSVIGEDPAAEGEGNNARRVGNLRLIRSRVAETLARDLKVNFIGEDITSPADLVAKAQVLRNASFETFYLLAIKAGKLVASQAVTSRVPFSASVFTEGSTWEEGVAQHVAFLKNAGADSYVLLHNHPSGDPSPSPEDRQVTEQHAQSLATEGINFLYHAIINHRTYSILDAYGNPTEFQQLPGATNTADPFLADKASAWNDAVGHPANSPDNVARLGRTIHNSYGAPESITGFVLNSRLQVVSTLSGSLEDFRQQARLKHLKEHVREQGGRYLSLYRQVSDSDAGQQFFRDIAPLGKEGWLLDAVYGMKGSDSYISAMNQGNIALGSSEGFFKDELENRHQVQEDQPSFSISPAQDAEYLSLAKDPEANEERLRNMVDEAAKAAGYHSRAKHGTASKFDSFDHKHGGKVTDATSARRAFFLTDDAPTAKSYAIYAAETGPVKSAMAKAEAAEKKGDWDGYDEAIREAEALDTYAASYKRRDNAVIIDAYISGKYLEFDAEGKTPQELHDGDIDAGITAIIKEAKRKGKDGVVYRNLDDAIDLSNRPATHYAIFNPSQIKSAEPVTYDKDGNIIPLSQRFNSADPRISYSLSERGVRSLESTIQARLSKGPKERVTFYGDIMRRMENVLLRYEDFALARNGPVDPDDLRVRLMEGAAEAEAIISALPPEIRGKVRIPVSSILDAKTERGKLKVFRDLIDQADAALEPYLVEQYRDAISTILDLARPIVGDSRRISGRLTPETQRLIAGIIEAIPLTPTHVLARTAGIEATLNDPAHNNDPDNEEHLALLDELETLDTFGSLATQDAARLAGALSTLEHVYAKGRGIRRFLEEAKRQERQGKIREVLDSLGLPHGPSQSQLSKRTEQDGLKELAAGVVTGHWSFHQIMEWLFPKSRTAREFQKAARKANRGAVRHKIDARERWEAFAANVLGTRTKRQTNHLLHRLSQRREWEGVKLKEGVAFEDVKLTEDQARAILRGDLKVGWHTDLIAMNSLAQAVADWDLLPTKDRSRRTYIRFQRLKTRGQAGPLHLSDLEALYLLQLAGQAEYLPTLDRYGFTETVLAQITNTIAPQALDIGDYLRREYADGWHTLNPVFQRLYGMDMPRIRNYAPGIFEHRDARPDGNLTDPFGGGGALGVNAMSAGFTKSRQNHMARPKQVNALAAYWAHTEQVGYFIHWAELSREMRSIFRVPDVRRSIEARYGTKALGDFMNWLDTLELDGRFMATKVLALDQLLNRALSVQAIIGLAWNIGTWFKQLSAAFGTAIHMPTREWFSGLTGAIADPSSFRKVFATETIQQRITEGFSPEDKQVLAAAHARPSDLMAFLEIGRVPIAWADALLTSIGGAIAYQAAYKQAKKAGHSEAQAEAHALAVMDETVLRSAQPATTQDKSLIENLYKNPFAQAIFQFKSDPRQKFAIATEAIALAKRGDITKPEAARRVLMSWVIYGLLGQFATDLFRSMTRDPDDDEVWNIEDYLKSALAGPISGFFFAGSVVDFILGKLITGHAFTNNPSPLDKAAEGILNIKPSRILDGLDEDSDTTWRDVMDASVSYSRVISQIAGTIDARAAALSVVIRLARDVAGGTATAYDLVFGDPLAKQTDSLLQEEKAALSEAREEASEQREDAWKEFRTLDPTQQDRRLDTLYRGTTDDRALARHLEDRQRQALLTPQERDLAALPTASRARLIQQILDRLPQQDRQPWLDKLRRTRVLTRSVEAAMAKPQ